MVIKRTAKKYILTEKIVWQTKFLRKTKIARQKVWEKILANHFVSEIIF